MTHLCDRTDCRDAISFEAGWGGNSPNYPGAPNVINGPLYKRKQAAKKAAVVAAATTATTVTETEETEDG